MQRCFTNILSGSVTETALFYEQLLGMTRHFESNWFVILTHEGISGLELGVMQRDHEIIPEELQRSPAGIVLTFVVEDCTTVYDIALSINADVLEPPTDMPYGQRRMLLRDPDGTLVDVSSPTP